MIVAFGAQAESPHVDLSGGLRLQVKPLRLDGPSNLVQRKAEPRLQASKCAVTKGGALHSCVQIYKTPVGDSRCWMGSQLVHAAQQ